MTSLAHTPTSNIPKYAQDTDRPYEGDPWRKQPEESTKSYDAFLIYLKLENRTYAETDRQYCAKYNLKYNKFTPRVRNWANKHRWVERALAYDNFQTAGQIAANKRALVKRSMEHANEAADARAVVMLPIRELRKRIEEQGGSLDVVNQLDDAGLMKLWRAMGGAGELSALQRSEREALSSTGDTVAPRAEIRAKGELVRRMLADGTVRELAERVAFEVVAPMPDQSDD